MGYWGIAYALGANYNKAWELFAPGEVDGVLPRIKDALDQAMKLEIQGTDLERRLLGALRARMPDDLRTRDYERWNLAYRSAMKKVYQIHPSNLDIASLYAESMMILTPWKLWDIHTGLPTPKSHALETQTVLEKAMTDSPEQSTRHPGILHFYIHLIEMSSSPEKALRAADALLGLVPDSGHLQHMPSHIYFLIGDYQRSVSCNILGVQADEAYVSERGRGGFYLVYRLHNMGFIVYSAMFAGQFQVALRYTEMIEAELPEELVGSVGHFVEAMCATRVQVYVRFGRWGEIKRMGLPLKKDVYPITTAFIHWGKAIAFSATGDVKNAEQERERYLQAVDRVPKTALIFPNLARDVLAVGTAFLDGELEYRKTNHTLAFDRLRESIRLYDGLTYAEPWSWLTPVRHAYAALNLEQGNVEEALRTYFADLGYNDDLPRAHQHPNNIWALSGTYESLKRLGREDEARMVWPLLRTARATADVEVEVSCFCRIEGVGKGKDLVQQGEAVGRSGIEDGTSDSCCTRTT
jgi:tetratricopeptide (TPR) repeat protein